MGSPTATPAPAPAAVPHLGRHRLLRALLVPAEDQPESGSAPRTRRDWGVDALMFVVALGLGFLGFAHVTDTSTGTALTIVDVGSGTALCCALWFRRRWPVPLALASTVVAAYSQTAGGAGAILLFSLAVHRDARWVAVIAVLQIPSVLISAAIWPDDQLAYPWLVLFIVVVLGFLIAWGMAVRSRRQLLSSLRERAERAEREQQLLVGQARDHERARIAREMHDVLAHRISLVSLHAGALEFRPDASPDEVAHAAGVIRASAHEALEDLREVIGVLRDGGSLPQEGAVDDAGPSEIRPQPSLGDLPALLRESRDAGMRIEEHLMAADAAVAGAVARTAYRVVQEGLTNARKHAWGTVVRVSSSGAPGDGLTVAVWTPAAVGGSGRDPRIPGAGTGLIGLQERTALAGGRLESGPTPDGGFLLRAWLPWSGDADVASRGPAGAGAVGDRGAMRTRS